jgi:hypothetical protein
LLPFLHHHPSSLIPFPNRPPIHPLIVPSYQQIKTNRATLPSNIFLISANGQANQEENPSPIHPSITPNPSPTDRQTGHQPKKKKNKKKNGEKSI